MRYAKGFPWTANHHVVHADEILSDAALMRLVPHAIRQNWEEWRDSAVTREFQSILQPMIPLELEGVGLANEVGVTLLAATYVGVPLQVPGISLHKELQRLVGAGLTPLEALQTATINPARVLGMADSLGTVEPGKLADLLLLDANPLDNQIPGHQYRWDGLRRGRGLLQHELPRSESGYAQYGRHQ